MPNFLPKNLEYLFLIRKSNYYAYNKPSSNFIKEQPMTTWCTLGGGDHG